MIYFSSKVGLTIAYTVTNLHTEISASYEDFQCPSQWISSNLCHFYVECWLLYFYCQDSIHSIRVLWLQIEVMPALSNGWLALIQGSRRKKLNAGFSSFIANIQYLWHLLKWFSVASDEGCVCSNGHYFSVLWWPVSWVLTVRKKIYG